MLRILLAALFFALPALASAADTEAPLPELEVGFSVQRLNQEPSLRELVELAENSDRGREVLSQISEWGFDLHRDLHELRFFVLNASASAPDFALELRGSFELAPLAAALSRAPDVEIARPSPRLEARRAGVQMVAQAGLAILGQGETFERLQGHLQEGSSAAEARQELLWFNFRVNDLLRSAHASLAQMDTLSLGLTVDSTPVITLEATLQSTASVEQGERELREALRVVAGVPEVGALGLAGFFERAQFSSEGRRLRLQVTMTAQEWESLAATLHDFIVEELR